MFRELFQTGRARSSHGLKAVILGVLACSATLTVQAAEQARQYAVDGAFTRNTVTELAKRLSQSAYKPADVPLSDELKDLSTEQYKSIKYKPEEALWANTKLPFQLQLLPRGGVYSSPVEVALVEDGQAHHLPYIADRFSAPEKLRKLLPSKDVGYSGIRLHFPLDKDGDYKGVAAFQGATYFRGQGKDQVWGLSARGLSLHTADPKGEEFPAFKAFWIKVPSVNTNSIVIYALLDSPSVTGAYRYNIRPGDNTIMDVEATLFPRTELSQVGLGAGTSMYLYSGRDRRDVDDFRPEVHNSDGLLMINGKGERLWRPLTNPTTLQFSAFVDDAPRGFGLMQRDRHFYNYQDLVHNYQKRPSMWVEPVGSWGHGAVTLVEIPTKAEIHDNIVAYWSPKKPIPKDQPYSFAYRLYWGNGPKIDDGEAKIVSSRSGSVAGDEDNARHFVIDYRIAGDGDVPDRLPKATVSASKGKVEHVKVQKNVHVHGYRLSFDLDHDDAQLSDLRAELEFPDRRNAETWLYRWTAE